MQAWGPSTLFLLTVPVGVAGLAVALAFLPTFDLGPSGKLDLKGFALLAIGVPLLTLGVSQIGITGRADTARVLLPLGLGLALVALFVSHSQRVARPLLDLRLFANPVFAAAACVTFTLNFAVLGAYLLMPLFFQQVWQQDVSMAGLLVGPQGAGAAIGILVSGRLVDRGRGVPAIMTGAALAAAASIALAFLRIETPMWIAAAILFIRGCGLGAAMNPSLAVGFNALAPQHVSDATPQMNVAQRLGAAIGTAVYAVVLARAIGATPPTSAGLEHAFSVANGAAAAAAVLGVLPTLVLWRASRRLAARPTPFPASV